MLNKTKGKTVSRTIQKRTIAKNHLDRISKSGKTAFLQYVIRHKSTIIVLALAIVGGFIVFQASAATIK